MLTMIDPAYDRRMRQARSLLEVSRRLIDSSRQICADTSALLVGSTSCPFASDEVHPNGAGASRPCVLRTRGDT
jgi:hypothetical protein